MEKDGMRRKRWNEMERDGKRWNAIKRWNEMERDGMRWKEMERDGMRWIRSGIKLD